MFALEHPKYSLWVKLMAQARKHCQNRWNNEIDLTVYLKEEFQTLSNFTCTVYSVLKEIGAVKGILMDRM